jgi:SAM-dependent methyltransferase
MKVIRGNLYDYPLYYDLVFGSDWQAELRFIDRCLVRYLDVPSNKNWHHLPTVRGRKLSLFEPACGTGRLVFRLAKQGHRVSGLDLNEQAVAFCNKRLQRLGLPESVFVGDMTDFSLPKPVDAAFNTINSFRHLSTEDAARSHLECMAEAVRPGGIYILGLHLTPTRGEAIDQESWSARRGHLQVNTSMWTIERNLRKRQERCGMTIEVYKPTETLRIEDEIVFRTYTWPQLQQLLKSVPQWEITAVHDFAYNLHRTVEIDAATEDVVLILRRITG